MKETAQQRRAEMTIQLSLRIICEIVGFKSSNFGVFFYAAKDKTQEERTGNELECKPVFEALFLSTKL